MAHTRYTLDAAILHYPRAINHKKNPTHIFPPRPLKTFNSLHLMHNNFRALSYVTPYFFFIRASKQYNKRRYTRVKTHSRASFWAGISLSTLCAYMCWPATIQCTEWELVNLITCDSYILLLGLYVILLQKLIFNHKRPFVSAISNKSSIHRGLKQILQETSFTTWKWF